VSEHLFTIGEVAERAHVATSAIRYYERLGLLVADTELPGSADTASRASEGSFS